MAIDNVRRKQLKEANKGITVEARQSLVIQLNGAIIDIMKEEHVAREAFNARKLYLLADLQAACDHPELSMPPAQSAVDGVPGPVQEIIGCPHCGLMVRKEQDEEEYNELMAIYNLQQLNPKPVVDELEEAVKAQKMIEAQEAN